MGDSVLSNALECQTLCRNVEACKRSCGLCAHLLEGASAAVDLTKAQVLLLRRKRQFPEAVGGYFGLR